MTGEPILKVQLSAGYAGRPVLEDVQFTLHRGEILGVVGSSGAGKSTLVMALLGLLPWMGGTAAGEVLFDGHNLLALNDASLRKLRGRRIALIPQSPMSALNAAISLQSHFDEAWRAHRSVDRLAMHARVEALMNDVQLPADREFLSRKPRQISVGQAQRVLIALALLHQPELLIADEPTSALDPVTQAELVSLLRRLNRTYGTSMVYISHDLISVLQLCDRMAVLSAGTIVETMHLGNRLQANHSVTRALLASLPVPAEILLQFRGNPAEE